VLRPIHTHAYICICMRVYVYIYIHIYIIYMYLKFSTIQRKQNNRMVDWHGLATIRRLPNIRSLLHPTISSFFCKRDFREPLIVSGNVVWAG